MKNKRYRWRKKPGNTHLAMETMKSAARKLASADIILNRWTEYLGGKTVVDACIYVLVSCDQPVYIGQTKSLRRRVADHYASGKIFDSVLCCPINPSPVESAIETRLIDLLKPRYNPEWRRGTVDLNVYDPSPKSSVSVPTGPIPTAMCNNDQSPENIGNADSFRALSEARATGLEPATTGSTIRKTSSNDKGLQPTVDVSPAPPKDGAEVKGNYRFPGVAGQLSDTGGAAEGAGAESGAESAKFNALRITDKTPSPSSPPSTPASSDSLLAEILSAWPILPVSVRRSLAALATAARFHPKD